jgi:carboxypeptidase family protein
MLTSSGWIFSGKMTSLATIVCLLMLLTPAVLAQTDTASIQGAVTDSQGAVISGATITAVNTGTNQTYTATSDAGGVYVIPAVVRGSYRVEIKANGFKAEVQQFDLNIREQKQYNAILQPGAVSETVEVRADVTLADTSTSSMGEVIQGNQITELPLNGRNFTQLALLTPGVTRGAYGSQASGIGNQAETFRYAQTGGAALSANGLRQQANNFILDGLDNNEGLVNTINIFPPVEATEEFRVDTSVAPAEFGRAGGAIVDSSLKSGTNQFHGTAFDFLRNSALDANSVYFNPITNGKPTPKSPFKRNQFGGTIGGPIIKNKLFVFGDFQGLRSDQPQNPQITTVPTPLMRQGNFSELLGAGLSGQMSIPACVTNPAFYTVGSNGNKVNSAGYVFDPVTCTPFGWNGTTATNIIPAGLINPVGLKYLNAFPAATLPGILNNFASQPQVVENYNDFDVRIDYNVRQNDTIFGRVDYGKDDTTQGTVLGVLPSGFGSGSRDNHPRGVGIGETHIFNSNVINDLRLGWSRPYFDYLNPFNNVPLAQELGIPNANRLPELGGGALIGPYGQQISYTGDGGPYIVPQKSIQLVDTVSWVHGNNSFRFGTSLLRRNVSYFISDYRGKGFFQLGNGTFTGYPVSELLDGFMIEYDISNPVNVNTISWETGYFAQDDWKISRRLTLNLGLRYDLFTSPYEAHNRWSNFDLQTGQLIEAGVGGASRSLVNTDTNNFAPRIGFAYDLFGTGKTVVRGGFGMFYFLDRGGVGNQLSANPDWSYANALQASAGFRTTLNGEAPLNSNNPQDATGAIPLPSPSINLNHPTNTQLIAVPSNNQNSSINEWNLQISQAVGAGTDLRVAYVGTKSDHLMTWYNLNGPQLVGAAVPFPGQGLNVIVGAANGSSNYNGLQVSMNRRMTAGLQYTIAYTYSHSLDNSLSAFSNTGNNQRLFINGTSALLNLNYGNSDDDQRQAFTFAGTYDLPFGHGRRFGGDWNGVANAILGGWEANVIASIGTGTPFDVVGNPPNSNCNGCQIRPNYLGGASIGDAGRDPNNNNDLIWLKAPTGSFVYPAFNGSGQFLSVPTLGRNAFYGPGYDPVDFAIYKNFGLTERLKMQFRAEMYNIFNSPQFANPDSNPNDGNFGEINSTREFSEREIQFALKLMF